MKTLKINFRKYLISILANWMILLLDANKENDALLIQQIGKYAKTEIEIELKILS